MKKSNLVREHKLGKYIVKKDIKTGKYIVFRTDGDSLVAIGPNRVVSLGGSIRTARDKAKKISRYTNNVGRIYSRDSDEINAAMALVNTSKEKLKEKYKRYQEEAV